MKTITKKILAAIAETGIKKGIIADSIGFNYDKFWRMTSGNYIPDVEEISRIAIAVNKPILYFFEDIKDPINEAEQKKIYINDMTQWIQQNSLSKTKALMDFIRLNGLI